MILRFVFPPVCIHCQEKTKSPKYPLCPACLELLTFAEPKQKVSQCGQGIKQAAVFEREGPAKTLLLYFQKKQNLGFAPALAAFMAIQLNKLNWPEPEIVIALTYPFFWFLGESNGSNRLLAFHIAQLYGGKFLRDLKSGSLTDKNVLVIDSTDATEKEVSRFVSKAREGFPRTVSLLCFLEPKVEPNPLEASQERLHKLGQ